MKKKIPSSVRILGITERRILGDLAVEFAVEVIDRLLPNGYITIFH